MQKVSLKTLQEPQFNHMVSTYFSGSNSYILKDTIIFSPWEHIECKCTLSYNYKSSVVETLLLFQGTWVGFLARTWWLQIHRLQLLPLTSLEAKGYTWYEYIYADKTLIYKNKNKSFKERKLRVMKMAQWIRALVQAYRPKYRLIFSIHMKTRYGS